jgi:site-specific recombinase XerD
MEDTNELLFKFKEHLAVLNRSPATIKAYMEHTKAFVSSVNDVKQMTRRNIEDYIAGLYDYKTIEGKPYKTGTICLRVRSIKRLFEFLEKANIVFINPAEFIFHRYQAK